MRQPAKPKPQAFEEVARVLNVYDMLVEELPKRRPFLLEGEVNEQAGAAVLAVAERIAARTEG